MRRVAIALGVIVGIFFIVRAVVEQLTIDYSDPSSYADHWGGPSLTGVLLVHCGLGVIAAIWTFEPIGCTGRMTQRTEFHPPGSARQSHARAPHPCDRRRWEKPWRTNGNGRSTSAEPIRRVCSR